jgi:hypothetical protein
MGLTPSTTLIRAPGAVPCDVLAGVQLGGDVEIAAHSRFSFADGSAVRVAFAFISPERVAMQVLVSDSLVAVLKSVSEQL